MMDIFRRIKNFFLKKKMIKICSQLQVSNKGLCLIKYLEDIIDGKDTYIESYEEVLNPFIEKGHSRVEAAEFELSIFKLLESYGANISDTDL